jgi:hypothetical protein
MKNCESTGIERIFKAFHYIKIAKRKLIKNRPREKNIFTPFEPALGPSLPSGLHTLRSRQKAESGHR